MAEYDLESAQNMVDVAAGIIQNGLDTAEAQRTAVYLGHLSIEVALKAFLERAGVPVADLRRLAPQLSDILALVDQCFILAEVVPGHPRWVPAKRLRSVAVETGERRSTIGEVIGQAHDAFQPQVLTTIASVVIAWVRMYWNGVRRERWPEDPLEK